MTRRRLQYLMGCGLLALALVLPARSARAQAVDDHDNFVSFGTSLGLYYLRVTGTELNGSNGVGLTLLPYLRYSRSLKDRLRWFVQPEWTGVSNILSKSVPEGGVAKAPWMLNLGLSWEIMPTEDDGKIGFVLPRASLSLGYGNFKVGDNRYVTGVLAMLSIDADFVSVHF